MLKASSSSNRRSVSGVCVSAVERLRIEINFSVNPWEGEDHAPTRSEEPSGTPQDGGVGNQKMIAGARAIRMPH